MRGETRGRTYAQRRRSSAKGKRGNVNIELKNPRLPRSGEEPYVDQVANLLVLVDILEERSRFEVIANLA